MKFYIECCKSKDKDTLYHALKVDFGYRVGIVTMEKDIMCELADIKMSDLYKMKAGDKVNVKITSSVA